MDVEWTTRTSDGVTLVEVVLTNDGPARQIRVSNELDGPVWPPRRRGVPAAGWDENGFEGVVEDRRTLGYATPAPASEPPVSVECREVTPDGPRFDRHPAVPAMEQTPDGVYRALSDPTPPRMAVPVVEATTERLDDSAPESTTENTEQEPLTGEVPSATASQPVTGQRETGDKARSTEGDDSERQLEHPAVASLFQTIERRIDDGEMLTEADTLPDAAWAVETVGGLTAVVDLVGAIETDRQTLRSIETRAAQLRERAEDVDVPTETLERLA